MSIPNFANFANNHFNGDLEAALEAIARYQPPYQASAMSIYVTAKVYVAWWAAALARRLPAGITVNAVSPGSVPATSFGRNLPFLMRHLMGPTMKLLGMSQSLEDGARRYIAAGDYDDHTTGHFFASRSGKVVGPVAIQQDAHFLDEASQEAFWKVITRLVGEAKPTPA